VKQVIPMHYGTFPILTGRPAQLEEKLSGTGIKVLDLKQGQPITW
jgi:L-ascorbate metabolism protein UlaG (beta-lactamase superfamily)